MSEQGEVAGLFREAVQVALAELKEMTTSLRAAFLLITYGLIAGGAGAFILFVDEKTGGQITELGRKATELSPTERQAIVDKLGESGVVTERFAEALLGGALPPLVFGVLVASTFAIPSLILLVGYNRVAEDLETGFARYVLQRVHRVSYLAGKLFGHWAVAYASILLVHGVLFALAAQRGVPDLERSLAAMPKIWAGMAFFVLAYASYTLLLSSLLPRPFLVLLFGVMGLFAIKALSVVLGAAEPALGKVWMGAWDLDLWALDPGAIGVYLGYSALFAGGAYLVFRWRDV
jgi:hypothetical protein